MMENISSLSITRQRNTIRFLLVIGASVIVGLIFGINLTIGLLASGALLFCVFVFISVDLGISFLFLSLAGVDALRKIFAFYTGGWSSWQLLIIDMVFILVLVSLFLFHRAFVNKPQLPTPFSVLLAIFIIWISIQCFNPTFPNLFLSVVGIRTYLLPIFAIVLGWYILDNWNSSRWRTASFIIVFVVLIIVLLGIYYSITRHLGGGNAFLEIILTPAEHAVRTWGAEDISITSSVFASSKRMGRFLLMTYPIVYIYLKESNRNTLLRLASLLFALGCLVSGSREALLLYIMMFAFLEYRRARFSRIVPAVVGIILAVFLIVGPEELLWRVEFTLSTPQDWLSRADYMLIIPVFEDMAANPELSDFFGFGAGRFGSGGIFDSENEASTTSLIPTGSQYRNGGVTDAGLYKLFVDLGLIGLLISVALQVYVLILPWRGDMSDTTMRASAAAILIWFVLFLKASTVLNDSIMMLFYWMYVGFIISKKLSNDQQLALSFSTVISRLRSSG